MLYPIHLLVNHQVMTSSVKGINENIYSIQVSTSLTTSTSNQVSKWVSLTATSLQTTSGNIIDASNIVITPSTVQVPLDSSVNFDVLIKVPQDTASGTYKGKIIGSAITGSDHIDVEITVKSTEIEYIGDLTAQYSDPITLKAKLTDSGNPLPDKSISFTLGSRVPLELLVQMELASATIKLEQPEGAYEIKTEFAGDNEYSPASNTKSFSIIREDSTITYTGDMIVPRTSGSINLRATLEEIDIEYGDLTRIKVNFTIYTKAVI